MFSYSPRCKMMIPPFSHVGYDPKTGQFGTYRRLHTENKDCRPTCGKIKSIIKPYQDEYRFAAENIVLWKRGDEFLIIIDNQLLKESREEGLFLKKECFIATHGDGSWQVVQVHSTAKTFRLISIAVERLGEQPFPSEDAACSGDKFPADWFYSWRNPDNINADRQHLDHNLFTVMSQIVTAPYSCPGRPNARTNTASDRSGNMRNGC